MMAEDVDVEADMEGLFGGEEQESATQTLTQEEAEQQREGGANLDVTGAAEVKQKRIIRNPQPKLDADRLMGPRGIQTLENVFENWKPRGKGKEFEDLDIVMKKMEHWAHRLYPKFNFDGVLGVLSNREGRKKTVQTHVKKIRLGMVTTAPVEKVNEEEEEDEREVERYGGEEPADQPDVFGELLRAAGSSNVGVVPPPVERVGGLTEEQKERIRRNKELAEQRKREKREREQREAEEHARLEAENAELDEEEELEREIHARREAENNALDEEEEIERELSAVSRTNVSASAASEWDLEDKMETDPPIKSIELTSSGDVGAINNSSDVVSGNEHKSEELISPVKEPLNNVSEDIASSLDNNDSVETTTKPVEDVAESGIEPVDVEAASVNNEELMNLDEVMEEMEH